MSTTESHTQALGVDPPSRWRLRQCTGPQPATVVWTAGPLQAQWL